MKLPEGFKSWIQFYDHVADKIGYASNSFILSFVDRNQKPFRIPISTLKAKCFDELIAKRIPKQLGIRIIDSFRSVHYHPTYGRKIEEMINVMSLPE